jgi:hypothetical protein
MKDPAFPGPRTEATASPPKAWNEDPSVVKGREGDKNEEWDKYQEEKKKTREREEKLGRHVPALDATGRPRMSEDEVPEPKEPPLDTPRDREQREREFRQGEHRETHEPSHVPPQQPREQPSRPAQHKR